ncbi:hypothetical protein M1L60_06060 [Actinoplanes sp. TRM 88003]|uniref:Uncharacterized protein n=1 Tax=Paractinoplanes aksuensis TaxID=2939490 RepID=A0ABT1DH34_9ACTN|nr:hypothetical protein [Actinoplanes aksuensis]MCO8270155.1 hypothetical protein [Actinoplanes aksuensis]
MGGALNLAALDPFPYAVRIAHVPRRVAALLAAEHRADWLRAQRLSWAPLRRLINLPDTDLGPLGRRLRPSDTYADLLKALPPSRRGAFHDLVHDGLGPGDRNRYPRTMEALPHAVREREARTELARAWVRPAEAVTRTWSACLPWPAATATGGRSSGGTSCARCGGTRTRTSGTRRARSS